LHNDTRPVKSVNTIRDFMIQYSYDPLIVKEHRRRLYIKNAQINYNAKHRIDINSIVESFRSHQENEINLEKNRQSLKNTENIQKNLHKKNSIDPNNNINTNNSNKIKEVTFKKSLINEYQSEYKKENRRLNNFNIDLNYNTNANNNNNNSKKILISSRNKNIIKSKSQENIKNIRKIQLDKDSDNNLITNILFDNSKIISNNNDENNFGLRKRNNSFTTLKNIKFYANTLFDEDINNLVQLNNINININFKSTKLLNNKNNSNNIANNPNVNTNTNVNARKKNTLIDNFSKLLESEISQSNNNKNFNKRNSMVDPINKNNIIEESSSPNKKSYLRSSYSIFNNDNKSNIGNKNKDKYPIDIDIDNSVNNNKNDYNKTFNDYGFDLENNFDNTNINIEDRNNYTDIKDANKIPSGGRGKIKSRRSQVLSGILNCDVKLGSSHIKITDLDKSSLRKRRDSINPEKEEK